MYLQIFVCVRLCENFIVILNQKGNPLTTMFSFHVVETVVVVAVAAAACFIRFHVNKPKKYTFS